MNQKVNNCNMEEERPEADFQHNNFSTNYVPFTDFITEKMSEAVVSAVVSDATYRVKELIQV